MAAYAGQEIRIKLTLRVGGTYYPSGGIWLDDLAVTSGDWYDWETFAKDTTLASRRFTEVATVLDDCGTLTLTLRFGVLDDWFLG